MKSLIKLLKSPCPGIVIGLIIGSRIISWWCDQLAEAVKPALRFLVCSLYDVHWIYKQGVGGYEVIGWPFYRITFCRCMLCGEWFVKESVAARIHKFYFDPEKGNPTKEK